MLDYFLGRMLVVSKSAQVMSILTMLVILTSAGPLQGMFFLVTGAGEPALYFIVYNSSINNRSRVHGSDRGCKGGDLTSGLDMDDLGIKQDFLQVHCDSLSAIYLAKNQVYHERMKHIDFKYHIVKVVLEMEISK